MTTINKPCKNKCTTTSLAADIICKGCGMTDEERRDWGGYSNKKKLIVKEICKYRLENYEECLGRMRDG